ncbi:MAG: alpha/beta hydrolase [Armatimonadetes bacterium]|nr:alpha/beta hydrolase [Armatimonadota bacterium]
MFLTTLIAAATMQSQPIRIPLWANGAPGSEAHRGEKEEAKDWWVKNIHDPSINVFFPPKDKATGAAIVIFPGGGHSQLVYPPEGVEPAQYLAAQGIVAIAVKYRLFREPGSTYTFENATIPDSYRAMRQVRAHAKEWNIDPGRIGAMGFSAGGENVSGIAFGSGKGDPNAPDPIDREDGKPSFIVEIYPGPLGIPESVGSDAPPAFFLIANDDTGHMGAVLDLVNKYHKAKASMEVHVLAQGGHGFNMGNRSKLESVKTWPQRLTDWLADNGWSKPKT